MDEDARPRKIGQETKLDKGDADLVTKYDDVSYYTRRLQKEVREAKEGSMGSFNEKQKSVCFICQQLFEAVEVAKNLLNKDDVGLQSGEKVSSTSDGKDVRPERGVPDNGTQIASGKTKCGKRNRRRGKGRLRRQRVFNFIYLNGTSPNRATEQYMYQQRADAWPFGETHTLEADLRLAAMKAEEERYNITAAPATRFVNSDRHTQGGVLLATHRAGTECGHAR